MDAGAIFAACRQGDEDAIQAVEDFGKHLGTGLASVTRLLDPGLILVGGGIARSFDLFEEAMRTAFDAQVPARIYPTRIEKAALGNDAGFIGAAFHALHLQ